MIRPAKNRGLHGNAPDKSPVALLLVDVINDLEFEGGMRDFHVHVPRDCVASIDGDDDARALLHLQRVLGIDLTPSRALDLPTLARRRRPARRAA